MPYRKSRRCAIKNASLPLGQLMVWHPLAGVSSNPYVTLHWVIYGVGLGATRLVYTGS